MSRGPGALIAALLLAATLTACTADRAHPDAVPAAPCLPAGSTAPAGAGPLAAVTLPCLAPGGPVRLGSLGRPAVVNLWASWCAPCKTELPAIEAYTRQAGSSVLVIGVVTGTARNTAGEIVADLGLTFPNLYDREQALLRAVERSALPVTLFVTADGRMAHVYNGPVLDTDAIARLARQYLNVGA